MDGLPAALRLLRARARLNQQEASKKVNGSPDFRTISSWEAGRKLPSMPLLTRYLAALGYNLHDFQDALDQLDGSTAQRIDEIDAQVDDQAGRMVALELRISKVERRQLEEISDLIKLIKRSVPAASEYTLEDDEGNGSE